MRKYNPYYDIGLIIKFVTTILIVFGLMKATGGAGYLIVIPFAVYALFMNRLELLLFWIILTNILVVTNGFFAPKNFIFGLGFRALLTGCGLYGALQFFSVRSSKFVMPLMGIFLYLIYMFVPSVQGWAPKVSCLKLLLFFSTYMAFAYISTRAQASHGIDMSKVRSALLAIASVYIFGSALLLPFPGISLMNAQELLDAGTVVTSLYKGMMNHSQSLGMVMCAMVTFLFADLAFHIQKPDKLYIALILCGIFMLYKTSTRTAMGSVLLSILFLTYLMFKIRGVNINWKSKVVSGMTMFFVISALAVLAIPSARSKVVKFAMKYADDDTSGFSMEYALKTRQFLMDQQMYNFHQKPAIGWGFQVSPEVGEMERRTGGLVLSAPVEKGVWITAILEEGGVFGLCIYVIYMLVAFFALMSRKAYMGSSMFLLIHVANLGEFTMFSMSGVGGMWYALLFFALVFDAKRLQNPNWRPAPISWRRRGPMIPPPPPPPPRPYGRY